MIRIIPPVSGSTIMNEREGLTGDSFANYCLTNYKKDNTRWLSKDLMRARTVPSWVNVKSFRDLRNNYKNWNLEMTIKIKEKKVMKR